METATANNKGFIIIVIGDSSLVTMPLYVLDWFNRGNFSVVMFDIVINEKNICVNL